MIKMTGKPDYDRRQFQTAAVLAITEGEFSLTESVNVFEDNSTPDLRMWLFNNGYTIGYHHIVPRCAPALMFYLWEI